MDIVAQGSDWDCLAAIRKRQGCILVHPKERKEKKQVRRMFMLVGLTMITVVVAAGVALAVTKTCKNVPCRGTDNDDVLYERVGNGDRDRIYGLKGNDDMSAALYSNDKDRLFGGRHGDRIVVNDGDGRDLAAGGRGRDTCLIDAGDQTRSCERINVTAAGVVPEGFGNTATNPQNEATDPGEQDPAALE
jgi:Ca2+-binding RTX toxin-like protein